jgi:hypothetical protein
MVNSAPRDLQIGPTKDSSFLTLLMQAPLIFWDSDFSEQHLIWAAIYIVLTIHII